MEMTHRNEAGAHALRRQFVNNGGIVSLIAFDPDRNLYVFDILDNDG